MLTKTALHIIRRSSPPEARQILRAIVLSLPANHQRALALYYRDGQRPEIAAESAGMGIDAFRELKNDVRARLAAAIRKLPEESFGDSVAAVIDSQPEMVAEFAPADLIEIHCPLKSPFKS
jgi:hypothetical protein